MHFFHSIIYGNSAASELGRDSRRQRRAMLFASGIAGCLAVIAIAEALVIVLR